MVQESLTQREDAHKETRTFAGLLINPDSSTKVRPFERDALTAARAAEPCSSFNSPVSPVAVSNQQICWPTRVKITSNKHHRRLLPTDSFGSPNRSILGHERSLRSYAINPWFVRVGSYDPTPQNFRSFLLCVLCGPSVFSVLKSCLG